MVGLVLSMINHHMPSWASDLQLTTYDWASWPKGFCTLLSRYCVHSHVKSRGVSTRHNIHHRRRVIDVWFLTNHMVTLDNAYWSTLKNGWSLVGWATVISDRYTYHQSFTSNTKNTTLDDLSTAPKPVSHLLFGKRHASPFLGEARLMEFAIDQRQPSWTIHDHQLTVNLHFIYHHLTIN